MGTRLSISQGGGEMRKCVLLHEQCFIHPYNWLLPCVSMSTSYLSTDRAWKAGDNQSDHGEYEEGDSTDQEG